MDLEKVKGMVKEIWPDVEISEPDSGVLTWDCQGPVIGLTASFDCDGDVMEVYFEASLSLVPGTESSDYRHRIFPLSELLGRLNIFEQKTRHWLANLRSSEWKGFHLFPENEVISFESRIRVAWEDELEALLQFMSKTLQ